MVFGWLKRRGRRKLLAQPFPAAWHGLLQRNVRLYDRLTDAEQAKVRDDLRILVAEKNWEGCGGLLLDDEHRVTIAGQIAVLVLGFVHQYFDRVQSILVYPDAYVAPDETVIEAGIVLEGDSPREGEAWYRGPVVLSWPDVLAGGRGPNAGHNLVFHEFAHQLDMLNGHTVDGIPPLESAERSAHWTRVMSRHYEDLVHDCARGRRGLLDCYGATEMSEFFAVATETFFQRPVPMRERHPQLYKLLRGFYRQDPAKREA